MIIDDSYRGSQAEFASLVGVSQPRVSQLIAEGALEPGAPLLAWVRAYCERLRQQADERLGAGGLDLVQERAALARVQREAQELRNEFLRQEYAPVALLEDVLAVTASAVAGQFDGLQAELDQIELPAEARATVRAVVESARTEWMRSTERLAFVPVDEMTEDADPDDAGEDDAA